MSKTTKTIPIGIGNRGKVTLTDISQTPGGTIWGTTPGGTRIKYDRDTLLKYSRSPVTKTPPVNLPVIPGVTKSSFDSTQPKVKFDEIIAEEEEDKKQTKKPVDDDNLMFGDMDIDK